MGAAEVHFPATARSWCSRQRVLGTVLFCAKKELIYDKHLPGREEYYYGGKYTYRSYNVPRSYGTVK